MLLSSLVIQRMLGFEVFPERGSKLVRAMARKASLVEAKLIEFMVFYFDGVRGLRRLALSFFFFGIVAAGGVVDSPQSVMRFLSFVRKLEILFWCSGRPARSLIS